MIIIDYHMPQLNLHLDDKESEKAERYSRVWKISKHDAVKRIIREFKREDKNV